MKRHQLVIVIALGLAFLGAIGIAAFQSYRSLVASHTLVTGRVTTDAIERYVKRTGKWPRSWSDLEQELDFHATQSARQAVFVDFAANTELLRKQTAEEFTAIRPAEHCQDNYREYWQIDKLLESLRQTPSNNQ